MEDTPPEFDLNRFIVGRLKEIREQQGLNQKEFSKLIHVSPSVYSRIENGEKELTFNFIQKVSEKTHTSLKDILNISGNIYNVDQQKGLQNQCSHSTLHIHLSPEQFEGLKDVLK